METTFKISTSDDHIIYGTLNSVESGTLIIFAHGLTGSQYEHHYMRAAEFFNPKGIDVCKFGFYATRPKARVFSETSIPIHGQDLQQVVDHYKDKYERIMLVGHSLGSAAILETDLSVVERIVLWDPTGGAKSMEAIVDDACYFDDRIGLYVLHNAGKEMLMGQAMVESRLAFADLDAAAKRITKPCLFLFASEENKKDVWRPFMPEIQAPYKDVEIPGATHVFVEEGVLHQAYEEMHQWLSE